MISFWYCTPHSSIAIDSFLICIVLIAGWMIWTSNGIKLNFSSSKHIQLVVSTCVFLTWVTSIIMMGYVLHNSFINISGKFSLWLCCVHNLWYENSVWNYNIKLYERSFFMIFPFSNRTRVLKRSGSFRSAGSYKLQLTRPLTFHYFTSKI